VSASINSGITVVDPASRVRLRSVTGEIVDEDAIAIGDLYRRAKTTIVESALYQIEVGRRLITKRAELAHGEWLPWLKANERTLGFGERCAQRLIAAAKANPTLASDLNESNALKISRTAWGHDHFRMTGEVEWYTPPKYIGLAREVWGGDPDLDPSTCAEPQKWIKAKQFYTKEDDGLNHEWQARSLWANFPYSRGLHAKFIDKLLNEISLGRVASAIMLTHSSTDTPWFQKAARNADIVCFTRGRIKFISPTGMIAAPVLGQAFFYWGNDVERFVQIFGRIAWFPNLW